MIFAHLKIILERAMNSFVGKKVLTGGDFPNQLDLYFQSPLSQHLVFLGILIHISYGKL